MSHLLWLVIFAGCMAWYCTITVYVAVKGASDIREMLKRLASADHTEDASQTEPHL